MNLPLVISIIAADRPGVIEDVADIISRHGGNWRESALSHLGGKFAGILLADIPDESQTALEEALHGLSEQGIRVSVDPAGSYHQGGEPVSFNVVGNDRPGIVGEISHALARHGVNVDELYTYTESAPMSGDVLFHAYARVILPDGISEDRLRTVLEELSDDLMVEFDEDEE